MICIVNDTTVNVSASDNTNGASGGTSLFLSGFLSYLLRKNLHALLLGDFNIIKEFGFSSKKIKASSNSAFIVKLWWYILFEKCLNHNTLFYCHRPEHLAVTLLSKGKHVIHLHGQPRTTINQSRKWLKKFIYIQLERVAIRRADLIIATDKVTVNLYTSLYPGIQSRIFIIPTGVNLNVFSLRNNPQTLTGIFPETKNIVFIGRLAYPKQVTTIINAFTATYENNANLHLWIAGNGPDEKRLKALAYRSKSSSNIHFTGQLLREQIQSLIHASDAGILISHNEGSPIVVKEFLACGKPVIVNDVGDITDYVKDGVNGYIVDPQQPGSIEMAMRKILETSKDMSTACRESMLLYDEGKIYEKVLQSLLQL